MEAASSPSGLQHGRPLPGHDPSKGCCVMAVGIGSVGERGQEGIQLGDGRCRYLGVRATGVVLLPAI